jgi:hypothetical protein
MVEGNDVLDRLSSWGRTSTGWIWDGAVTFLLDGRSVTLSLAVLR